MRAANIVALLLCTGSLSWHAVASRTRFRTIGQTPPRMRLIAASFAIGVLVNVAAILMAEIRARELGLATALYGVALGLFAWACAVNRQRPLTVAFSTDVPAHLVTTGPYRLIRHPFYTAYCLTWFAGVIVTRSWLSAIVAIAMLVQYVQAARLEEAKFANSPLAESYRNYRTRTTTWLLPVLTSISRL